MTNKRNGSWINADGLIIGYGSREVDLGVGKSSRGGNSEEITLTIDLAALSGVATNANVFVPTGAEGYRLANIPKIPSNSFIESVTVSQIETDAAKLPTSGTNVSVGGVSDTGFSSGTLFLNQQVRADHDAAGETVVYTAAAAGEGGSAVGGISHGTHDLYPVPVISGTYDGGTLRVVIRYSTGKLA